jgi:hypothetical protein
MSEMKLIMESWRKFEKGSDAGTLCLFENRSVRRVPFEEALNSIGNTEKELDLFLEKWEKSLDYELKRINEVDWKGLKENPVLYLSTQIFLFIQKAKDKIIKYSSKILAAARKIKAIAAKFEKKNPKIYKIGTTVAKVATAAVALYVVQSILGDASAYAGDLTDSWGDRIDAKELLKVGKQLSTSENEDLQKLAQNLIDVANAPEDVDVTEKFGSLRDVVMSVAERDVEEMRSIPGLDENPRTKAMVDSAAEIFDQEKSKKFNPISKDTLKKAGEDIKGAFDDVKDKLGSKDTPSTQDTAPPAPRENPFSNSNRWDTVLSQAEMKIDMDSKLEPDMLKLLKIAANGHSRIDPETTKRAQELLSQIK